MLPRKTPLSPEIGGKGPGVRGPGGEVYGNERALRCTERKRTPL
jgi:hypothetical protein